MLKQLYGLLEKGYPVYPSDVDYAVRILSRDRSAKLRDIFLDTIYISAHKRVDHAEERRAEGLHRRHPQLRHRLRHRPGRHRQDLSRDGDGGRGAHATNSFARMILTRPAVEAGEKLGFLPGDLAEKVNPYLRPLYDALHDMVDFDRARKMLERGAIEVAPLAFMRGRTLNDSFVILDEAQNTTHRADEDVPHPPRLRLEGGDHRRRHADRPAGGQALGAERGAATILAGVDGIRFCELHRARRRPPPAGAGHHHGLRPREAGPTAEAEGRAGRVPNGGGRVGERARRDAGDRPAEARPLRRARALEMLGAGQLAR